MRKKKNLYFHFLDFLNAVAAKGVRACVCSRNIFVVCLIFRFGRAQIRPASRTLYFVIVSTVLCYTSVRKSRYEVSTCFSFALLKTHVPVIHKREQK